MSSSVGCALIAACHAFGWPVAKGGSRAITDALAAVLARARRPDRDRRRGSARWPSSATPTSWSSTSRPAPSPRSPATGCPAASPAPTAATGTGRARSSSTSRSRGACRGRTRPAGGPGRSTSAGRFEEIATAERDDQPRRDARAALRGRACARRPAVPRRPEPLQGRPPSGLGLRARAERLRRGRDRGDPRPDRALRPGLPRADRGQLDPGSRPSSRPTTPTTSAATSSPAPTRRSRSCSGRASRSIPTAPASPASTSARPRRRRAPAPTAWAATTPPARRCGTSAEARIRSYPRGSPVLSPVTTQIKSRCNRHSAHAILVYGPRRGRRAGEK